MFKFGRFIYIGVSVLDFIFSFIAIIVLPAVYKNEYNVSIFDAVQLKVWFAMQFFALLCSVGMIAVSVLNFFGSRSEDDSSSSSSSTSEEKGSYDKSEKTYEEA